MKPESRQYRPEIDGLRAVAILVALLFHLDVPYFSGGFVGVDVFLVISGFLITGLIKSEVNGSGGFSFSRFYIRRIRRLFPAILVTVTVVFAASIFLLSPQELVSTAAATITALFSVSNFYFWSETGYFAAEAIAKPLMHTWSLGVEEQFYLLWPAFVYLLLRGRNWVAPVGIVIAGFLSYLMVQLIVTGPLDEVIPKSDAALYYLTPFRIFEFAIGSLLVWLIHLQPRRAAVANILLLAGLALILYPVVSYSRETPYPSVFALLPCIGAALVILSGQSRGVGLLLNNRLMLMIGLSSYSIYLVHWPIIVFWRYYTFEVPGVEQQALLFILAIACGYLLCRYVETPFRITRERNNISNRWFAIGTLVWVLIVTAVAAHAWKSEGWPGRLPDELFQSWKEVGKKRAEYWGSWQVGLKSPADFSQEKLSVVVIGDSFAYDVANMLRDQQNIEVYYYLSTGYFCTGFTLKRNGESEEIADYCAGNRKKFEMDYSKADVIILADRESVSVPFSEKRVAREYRANFQRLRKGGFSGPILVYGARPQYREPVYDLVLRHGRIAGAGKYASGFLQKPIAQMRDDSRRAKGFYRKHDVYFFSPVEEMCEDSWCDVLTENNELMYFDKMHFNYSGVKERAPGLMRFIEEVMASNPIK